MIKMITHMITMKKIQLNPVLCNQGIKRFGSIINSQGKSRHIYKVNFSWFFIYPDF